MVGNELAATLFRQCTPIQSMLAYVGPPSATLAQLSIKCMNVLYLLEVIGLRITQNT